MKRVPFLIITFICLAITATAQTKQYGKIRVIEEEGIAELVAQTDESISGYRIQIFTGNANERQKAQNIKAHVESTFGINAYVDYESPLFKVRVGDFIDKLEATAMKHKLKQHYSNAYLVKTKRINL